MEQERGVESQKNIDMQGQAGTESTQVFSNQVGDSAVEPNGGGNLGYPTLAQLESNASSPGDYPTMPVDNNYILPVQNGYAGESAGMQTVAGGGSSQYYQPEATQVIPPVVYPSQPEAAQYSENYLPPVYQSSPPVEQMPEKESDTFGKVLVVLIVILSLLIVGGLVTGAAYYKGWISFDDSETVSSSKDSSSNTDSNSSTSGDSKEITGEEDKAAGDSNKDDTEKEKKKEDDSNLNSPPNDAKQVSAEIKKLNDDATDSFSEAVADSVRSHSFSPNSSYDIQAYSPVVKKNFSLSCTNPSSKRGWVHCVGNDTRGNVQIWVKAK